MQNSIAKIFKEANINETQNIKVLTNDGNDNVILKIEWDHFAGSVLEMKEQDFVYDKNLMIADEKAEVKAHHDYAFFRTADMHPLPHWRDIANITKKHLDKLDKLKDCSLNNKSELAIKF